MCVCVCVCVFQCRNTPITTSHTHTHKCKRKKKKNSLAPHQKPGPQHSWVGWWEADWKKLDGKLPEWGLNSGPQDLSQGHNHYTTYTHTHTHTHTLTLKDSHPLDDVHCHKWRTKSQELIFNIWVVKSHILFCLCLNALSLSLHWYGLSVAVLFPLVTYT